MPDDYTQSDTPVPTTPYRLFSKSSYEVSDWTEQPNVDLLTVVDGANSIASIVLRYQCGELLREKATAFETVTPLDWIGVLVMVELYDRGDDGEPDYDTIKERWIGTVVSEDRENLGTSDDGATAYNQTLLAQGLEQLLNEKIVTGTWIESRALDGTDDDTKYAVLVDRPMAFNAPRNGPVPWDRNRTKDMVTQRWLAGATDADDVPANDGGAGGSVHVFAEIGDDTREWNIREVLDYLVTLYSPELTDDVYFRISTTDPTITAPEDADALEEPLKQLVAAPLSVDGKTLFDCLNSVLRPERGLGWRLVYDEDTKSGEKGPIIVIFSIQAEAVTIDDKTFPAAVGGLDLDVTDRRDVSWQTTRDIRQEYGTIVVRGEELLTCFSISSVDQSLTKGWKTQEETAYANPPDAGSAGDDGYEEKVAKYRARSRVWAEYVLKDDWNLIAKNGAGGGDGVQVNPIVDDNGEPDYDQATSMSVFDKRFERFIPIEVEKPAEATPDPKPQYQEPVAFIKEPYADTESWIDLVNNLNAKMPRVSYYAPLEDRPGFKIRTDPNHLLAGGAVEGDESDDAADWADMILTAAMRTGTRLSMTTTVAENDPLRVLTIDVDHAEMWILLKDTVKSVKADGTLVRQDANLLVRDDRKRLRVVRDLAKAWYGQGRKPLSLQFRSLTVEVAAGEATTKLTNGQFINSITDGPGAAVDINTVISRRSFDFVKNTATYETGYTVRPDFSTIA